MICGSVRDGQSKAAQVTDGIPAEGFMSMQGRVSPITEVLMRTPPHLRRRSATNRLAVLRLRRT